jgi:hypothetical protein
MGIPHFLDGLIGMRIESEMQALRALSAVKARVWSAESMARLIGGDDHADSTDEREAARGLAVFLSESAQRIDEIETAIRAVVGLPKIGWDDPRQAELDTKRAEVSKRLHAEEVAKHLAALSALAPKSAKKKRTPKLKAVKR